MYISISEDSAGKLRAQKQAQTENPYLLPSEVASPRICILLDMQTSTNPFPKVESKKTNILLEATHVFDLSDPPERVLEREQLLESYPPPPKHFSFIASAFSPKHDQGPPPPLRPPLVPPLSPLGPRRPLQREPDHGRKKWQGGRFEPPPRQRRRRRLGRLGVRRPLRTRPAHEAKASLNCLGVARNFFCRVNTKFRIVPIYVKLPSC